VQEQVGLVNRNLFFLPEVFFARVNILIVKKPGRKCFDRKIFMIFNFRAKKFLGRPTFDRNFFGIFNFRTGKNSRKLRSRKIRSLQVYDGEVS